LAAQAAAEAAQAAVAATTAATAATSEAAAAALLAETTANNLGCLLNIVYNEQGEPSPYTPPSGEKCSPPY
jgi:hypothetical protein